MAATKKTETKAAVVNETAKPVAEVKEAAPEAAAPEVKEIVKTPVSYTHLKKRTSSFIRESREAENHKNRKRSSREK